MTTSAANRALSIPPAIRVPLSPCHPSRDASLEETHLNLLSETIKSNRCSRSCFDRLTAVATAAAATTKMAPISHRRRLEHSSLNRRTRVNHSHDRVVGWRRRRDWVRSARPTLAVTATATATTMPMPMPLPAVLATAAVSFLLFLSPTCRAEDAAYAEGEGSGGYVDYEDDGGVDTVLGVLQTTDPVAYYTTLVLYALLLCVVGWTAILYPFVFCPRFDETVRDLTKRGVKLQGRIISMRRGRVFNPLRYCLPTRYNCYVTVEYNGTRKELAVDEAALDVLAEREDGVVDVYALPGFPQSGVLETSLQSHEVTLRAKILHALAALLLLGLGIWTSLVSPAELIYSSADLWKLWVILFGHVAAFGLAYWACNFVHVTRVEALLYGTVDADGLQEYAETHHLANRGCSRGAMEMGPTSTTSADFTALADSKDEVSEPSNVVSNSRGSGDEEAQSYRAMS